MDGGAGQLDELPWSNLDLVSITFSRDVVVTPHDLSVGGITNAAYTPTGFSYDGAARTATWAFDRTIPHDRIVLALPQILADRFQFRMNVLPGDVNRSGRVDAADVLAIRSRQGTALPATGPGPADYPLLLDVNGTGRIDLRDLREVRLSHGRMLPAPAPASLPRLSERFPQSTRSALFSRVPILDLEEPIAAAASNVL
jgi:hypothetical protein